MKIKDFFFSYIQSIKVDLAKKKYFKSFRKLFNYPYKFILDKFRELFSLGKNNLDLNEKIDRKTNFDDLFMKFNSDKASKFVINNEKIIGHNYSPFYEKHLHKYKNFKNLNILEIGSLRGGATTSFFNYFNKPNIICADINPFQLKIFSKKIRPIFVDTQSENVLRNLSSFLNQELDIVIDDGSHNIKDQMITFSVFFKNLRKGGIYVIEDSSQYLSAKHLNIDNLNFGSKEILLSLKKNFLEQIRYLSHKDIDILRKMIGNIFVEKGQYYENNINISEIIFIEKI